MIKILYLIDTLEVGGAEKSLLDILPRFQNVEPVICHLYCGQILRPAYEKAGIKVISLNISGKYSFIDAIRTVRLLIRELQPVLIHSTLFRSDIVSRIAGYLEGVPVVNSFVSDSYAEIRRQGMSAIQCLKHRFIWGLNWSTTRLVAGFVANSQTVKHANCRALGTSSDKVQVIYRGRDLNVFLSPMMTSGQRFIEGFDLPSSTTLIFNVGRLIYLKGQEELIRAMPRVLLKHPDTLLLIAGEGPYRPELEKLIGNFNLQNTVHLLGNRHDVPQLLRVANLFVSPSHYEGLPGAVVEAMLSGVPVVLTDIDVHREMVPDDGTVRLTRLMDADDLANAIIEMLDNPERSHSMGMKAQARARELFDINKIVAQYEHFYEKVLIEWKRKHSLR